MGVPLLPVCYYTSTSQRMVYWSIQPEAYTTQKHLLSLIGFLRKDSAAAASPPALSVPLLCALVRFSTYVAFFRNPRMRAKCKHLYMFALFVGRIYLQGSIIAESAVRRRKCYLPAGRLCKLPLLQAFDLGRPDKPQTTVTRMLPRPFVAKDYRSTHDKPILQ